MSLPTVLPIFSVNLSHPNCFSWQSALFFQVPFDLNFFSKFCCKLSHFLWKEVMPSVLWSASYLGKIFEAISLVLGMGQWCTFLWLKTPSRKWIFHWSRRALAPGLFASHSWLRMLLLYKLRQEGTGPLYLQFYHAQCRTFLSWVGVTWKKPFLNLTNPHSQNSTSITSSWRQHEKLWCLGSPWNIAFWPGALVGKGALCTWLCQPGAGVSISLNWEGRSGVGLG